METNFQPSIDFKKNQALADTKKEETLKKACQDFEAIFLKQLLTTMRASIPKNELFNDGFAKDIYQSMSDDQLSQSLSKGKGMGFGDALYSQISRII